MSKCTIFEQANRYVGALKAGLPSAAKRYKEGIYDTIRLTESCEPICSNKVYPAPCCCKTFYLDCGVRLVVAELSDDFEVAVPPIGGKIEIDDAVYYVPNEGFAGEDEFQFTRGGLVERVCVEVVSFDATMEITELEDNQIALSITTDCDSPSLNWGEGLVFEEYSIILPDNALYAPVVDCGLCTKELQAKYVDFYLAGLEYDGRTSLKYNSSPVEISAPTLNHGGEVWDLIKDNGGNIYTSGDVVSGATTRKYLPNGNEAWSVNHGGTVKKMALDSSGNLYVVGRSGSGGRTFRKYDMNGTEQWSLAVSNELDGIAIAPNGNIYVCGNGFQGSSVWAYDPNGNFVLSFFAGGIVSELVFDSQGYLYTGGWVSNGVTTRKFDYLGNEIWAVNHGSVVSTVAMDSEDNLYTAGYSISGISLRKYDSDGNELWNRAAGGRVWALGIDANDNVFAAGNLQSGRSVRRYNKYGDLIWDLSFGTRARAIFIDG